MNNINEASVEIAALAWLQEVDTERDSVPMMPKWVLSAKKRPTPCCGARQEALERLSELDIREL